MRATLHGDAIRIAVMWPLLGAALFLLGIASGLLDHPDTVLVMFGWLEWSLLTPLIVWYSRTTERFVRWRGLRHVLGALAAALLHLLLFSVWYARWDSGVTVETVLRLRYSRHLVFGAANYSLIVAAAAALAKRRAAREASLARMRLGQQISLAEFELARTRVGADDVVDRLADIERRIESGAADAQQAIYRLTRMLRGVLDEHRTTAVDVPPPNDHPVEGAMPGRRAAINAAVTFAAFGLCANLLRAGAFAAQGIAPPWQTVAALCAGWCVAGLFAPLLMYGSRALALRARGSGLAGAGALGMVALFAFATEAAARSGIVRPAEETYALVDDGLTLKVILGLFVVAGVHAAVLDWRRYTTELQTIALSRRLHEARLASLMAQLQPHFLFNALNSIVTLAERDAATAATVTRRLRELLQAVFRREQKQEVPVSEEVEVTASYIAIEQTRLGARLRFASEIDPAARQAMVPALSVQPLVENAIRHGISPRASGGAVTLRCRAEDGARLIIEVEDDGVGLDREFEQGIGLSNIAERLRYLYGEAHSLLIAPLRNGGTLVRLTLPLRIAPEAS
jgi:two-component sensor histidine kinase